MEYEKVKKGYGIEKVEFKEHLYIETVEELYKDVDIIIINTK